MPEVISISAAKHAGSTRYFTGDPCPKGHICERFVSTRGCVQCIKANKLTTTGRASENARRRKRYLVLRDKIDARNRIWAQENPDKAKSIKNRWAQNNPEKIKLAKRKYNQSNPETVRGWFRRRHARLKGASGSHTESEITELLIAQNHQCANPFCRVDLKSVRRHLDHIVPLTPREPSADTGSNSIENLQWLCWPCNARKTNKSWEEFLANEPH